MSYRAFNAHADKYDVWFDGEPGTTIFTMEVECLQPLLNSYHRPYLEIGVGSGRFAQALGVEYGVDPALALLKKAKARSIKVKRASGENLPFPDGIFGGVLIALALCFVNDPLSVLQEASRVLMDKGGLVLGLILRDSPWAEFYAAEAREGHPIYSKARFLSKDEVDKLLQQCYFDVIQYRSILFQPPGQSSYRLEHPLLAYQKSSGFTAISARKR